MVCAGVKSILDVGATLERLETLNVTVLGYGTDRFPGFYLSDSGHPVAWRVGLPGGGGGGGCARTELGTDDRAVVVANPLPPDEQLDPALHDRVLAEGLAAAERAGVAGKDVTPVPARLPRARDRRREPRGERAARDPQRRPGGADRGRAGGVSRIVVLGDVMVDVVARLSGPLAPGSDAHAVIRFHGGGSAANTAAWLAEAGAEPVLVGRVGDDERGRAARDELRAAGVDARPGRRSRAADRDLHRARRPRRRAHDGARCRSERRAVTDADLADELLASAGHLHVAGYALLRSGIAAGGARGDLAGARGRDQRVGGSLVGRPAVARSSSTTPRAPACCCRTPRRRGC